MNKPIKCALKDWNPKYAIEVKPCIGIPEEFCIAYSDGENYSYKLYCVPGLPVGWVLVQGLNCPDVSLQTGNIEGLKMAVIMAHAGCNEAIKQAMTDYDLFVGAMDLE